MTTLSKTTKPVSATIGDTLSDNDIEQLHQVTEEASDQTRHSKLATMNNEMLSHLKAGGKSVESYIHAHPYKSAGLAVLGGALLYNLFNGKK